MIRSILLEIQEPITTYNFPLVSYYVTTLT